jgi:hypothetical protein
MKEVQRIAVIGSFTDGLRESFQRSATLIENLLNEIKAIVPATAKSIRELCQKISGLNESVKTKIGR